VLSTAVRRATLADFADRVGTEMLMTDDDTTTRRFRRELPRNAAHHRPAQGLGR
jgi:hypothetical protein